MLRTGTAGSAPSRHWRVRSLAPCARYASTDTPTRKRVYVIAGEPSGDAIGAKVIAALRRKEALVTGNDPIIFRGIGGPQMMSAGGFASLFPMDELSVMGLVEVLPSVLRIRRRLAGTLDDIRAFRPDVVLSIDSKGFTFRVQRALASDPQLKDAATRMHCVAPSVWAYKHRKRKTDFTDLQKLLHKMFVILPFEKPLFEGARASGEGWCEYVGHPAVEDFLDFHGAYDAAKKTARETHNGAERKASLEMAEDALLRGVALDGEALWRQGDLFERLMVHRRADADWRARFRVERGLPRDAFLVCALVGSRENEVRRTIRSVLEAVDAMRRPSEQLVQTSVGIPIKLTRLSSGSGCVVRRPIHVVFPTVRSVAAIVQHEIAAFCESAGADRGAFDIVVDASARDRIELFQAADAAVAVSGTIVMETALAALPTVAIYRANRVTEVLAKQLSAVRFVSIPNLLLGREAIPELLFRDCTAPAIAKSLREIYNKPQTLVSGGADEPSQLAMALSTLAPWPPQGDLTSGPARPVRGSELVANAVWRALHQ